MLFQLSFIFPVIIIHEEIKPLKALLYARININLILIDSTVAKHVTNDVCFIPILRAAILKFLPARRRFSRFYDTEKHLLEDKRTSEVSKQYYLPNQTV